LINQRHQILSTSLKVIFIIITIRLFYWQILKGPELKKQALNQTQKIEKVLPQRGLIFSSDNFPLAVNQTNYLLSIYKPNLKISLKETINQIDNIKPDFSLENGTLVDNFLKNDKQLWISFPTLFNQKETEALTISGVSFEPTAARFYPEGNLAKNVIGSLGQNQFGAQIGYGGLEAYYDKQLRGQTGFFKTAQNAVGESILSQKTWQTKTVNGRHLHTFINRSVQFLIEQKLSQALEIYQAESGAIIVSQPQTGQIIAMTSLSYDASTSAQTRIETNWAINHLFEPGSIFKPLVVAIALDSRSINLDYICSKCDQSRVIGQYSINNWDEKFHPDTNLKDTLKNSDNISMSFIIDKIGLDIFLKYFKLLNLDRKTGIDLQGEAKPLTKNYWSPLDLATASFGQGFALTQLQFLNAFNAIANDGYIIKPQVLNYFSENRQIVKTKTAKETPIFDSQTIRQLKDILKYVVEDSNLNKIKPQDMEVCGKSGTAQIAQFGQYQDATIASFVGFSPCQDPLFSLIVTLVKPKASPWGSTTAAPVWFDLASQIPHLL